MIYCVSEPQSILHLRNHHSQELLDPKPSSNFHCQCDLFLKLGGPWGSEGIHRRKSTGINTTCADPTKIR